MSIILVILKWVGIVAGGIVGLVILLAVLVVCVPVCYQLSGDNRDVVRYQYRVSWLCHIVSVAKKMDSDKVWLRLFGIPVKCLAGGNKRQKKKSTAKQSTDGRAVPPPEAEEKSSLPSGGQSSGEKVTGRHNEKREKKRDRRKGRGKRKVKKSFSFAKLSSIIKFMRTAENQRAFRTVWRELGGLIRYLAPRKVQGKLVIGTGDPSYTGLVIGGISLLPFAYREGVIITPDFDEKILQAEGKIKGRIQVLYVLKLCVRLYRDRELRRLWDNIQKFKKEAA